MATNENKNLNDLDVREYRVGSKTSDKKNCKNAASGRTSDCGSGSSRTSNASEKNCK